MNINFSHQLNNTHAIEVSGLTDAEFHALNYLLSHAPKGHSLSCLGEFAEKWQTDIAECRAQLQNRLASLDRALGEKEIEITENDACRPKAAYALRAAYLQEEKANLTLYRSRTAKLLHLLSVT